MSRRSDYDPYNDYYLILGVNAAASTEQIQAAFRQRAKMIHPDRNADPQAKERFQHLNEAYDTLSDPLRRAEYDKRRRTAGFEAMGSSASGAARAIWEGVPAWRAVLFGLWRGPYRTVLIILAGVAVLSLVFFFVTFLGVPGDKSADSATTATPAAALPDNQSGQTGQATLPNGLQPPQPVVPLPGGQRPADFACPTAARIISPAANAELSVPFSITGVAQGGYELDWAAISLDSAGRPQPFDWHLLVRSGTATADGILAAESSTTALPKPADVALRLIVTPGSQQPAQICQITVHLN